MAQYQAMRCFHHFNCEDRPAVTRCSKCGKGLCRECADNLRSEDTGKILCTECLNQEMAADVGWAMQRKKAIRKEMIFILVGFLIGLAAEIFFGVMMSRGSEIWTILFGFSLVFFLPTLLASLGTIVSKVGDTFESILLRIIFFVLLCVISPIIFIWRLVKRGKDIKRMKTYATLQALKYEANEEYAAIAAKMTTRLTTEEFERNMAIKYSALLKSNKEEYDRRTAQDRALYNEQVKKNAEYETALKQKSAEVNQMKKEMTEIQAQVGETNKKAARNAKKAKKESRSTVDVDSGDDAA